MRPWRSSAVPAPSARPAREGAALRAQAARATPRRELRARCCPVGRTRRSAPARRRRSARAAGGRMGAHPPASLGHLWQRPRDCRRPLDPLLRSHRLVPVRARARGGGRSRGRQACRRRAGAGLRDAEHHSAVPRVRARRPRQLSSASPSATSNPGCSRGSAATQAGAGRPSWLPTNHSSTQCPTT